MIILPRPETIPPPERTEPAYILAAYQELLAGKTIALKNGLGYWYNPRDPGSSLPVANVSDVLEYFDFDLGDYKVAKEPKALVKLREAEEVVNGEPGTHTDAVCTLKELSEQHDIPIGTLRNLVDLDKVDVLPDRNPIRVRMNERWRDWLKNYKPRPKRRSSYDAISPRTLLTNPTKEKIATEKAATKAATPKIELVDEFTPEVIVFLEKVRDGVFELRIEDAPSDTRDVATVALEYYQKRASELLDAFQNLGEKT